LAAGGGGNHRDAQGVVVAGIPPLCLLQDVLRVVHGDDPRVRDEVGEHQLPIVVSLFWYHETMWRRVDKHSLFAPGGSTVADQVHIRVLVVVQGVWCGWRG